MTEAQDMEEQISRGLRERVNYFKEQADSLTLEGVRRVLEKDLGLKKFALDVHKRFVKKCLEEGFASLGDECSAKKTEENGEQAVTDEEKAEASTEPPNGEKENNSVDDVKGSRGSREEVKAEPESEKTDIEDVINEDTVKKAVNDRAAYFREHAATITMVGVRRLLEDDLKLEKHALDVHKALIKMAVNEVIDSAEAEDKEVNKGERSSDADVPEQSSSEEAEIEDEKKPKTPKKAIKERATNSEGQKKRKRTEEKDLSMVRKKKAEVSETQKSDDSDEDGSQTSGEDRVKKRKEASSQVYGKHVEHLKSVIKACGMNVPPAVYKRAKQAPENKREGILAKELEEILKKEGLSTNPSEKEIKAVKKKKERAKELEGIDTSNIVSSSRRRSSSFFTKPPPSPPPPPPPKAKSPDEDCEEAEGEEDEDDDEEESEEGNSDSGDSSEEFNEDADDESD